MQAITLLKRNNVGEEVNPDHVYHHSLKLLDYVNAIIQVAGYYGIPVLDLYNKSGLYPYPYTGACAKTLMPDGLHPNEAGHEIIARMLTRLLDTL